MSSLTRRLVLQMGCTAPLAMIKAHANANVPLELFEYRDVELRPSLLRDQFDQNHRFFSALSEDRLLKIYRQRTGHSAPGPDMGGWYDDFCPGAHFGQYVSALARFSAVTNSDATRAKVARLVKGYAETLDTDGTFFADLRYPAYTYDKLVCALVDAKTLADDQTAFDVLAATTRAARQHMAEKALTDAEKRARPHRDETYLWDETYTLAENLFLAYQATGDRLYYQMAERYIAREGFFDPLADGQDVLPGRHAYSHVNALSSGMQGYLNLHDARLLRAVVNAVDLIHKDQSYATGGWGPNEAFVTAGKGELGKSLGATRRSFETPCGCYAHMKVMRYLLRVTRDSRYGDSMERVIYNGVLGAKPIQEDGSSFYYSDYHTSGVKAYRRVIPGATYRWDLDGRWPCCSGTLPQAAADYGISTYLRSPGAIYAVLYHPSRVTWKQGSSRLSLEQQTDYPRGNVVRFQIAASSPERFALHLRIPAWAGPGTAVEVNGRALGAHLTPGAFLPIERTWKSGDRVELQLDQSTRLIPVDAQTPDQVAVVRGPQVLFAIASDQPTIPSNLNLSAALKPANGSDWTLNGTALRPFPAIQDEVYQTYLKLDTRPA